MKFYYLTKKVVLSDDLFGSLNCQLSIINCQLLSEFGYKLSEIGSIDTFETILFLVPA